MNFVNRIIFAAAAILAGLALAGLTMAAPKKSSQPNWLLTFSKSADGGHIVGNPDAKVKLIEYASYTCGHCAKFEMNDAPALKRDYIAKGDVSLEIRPYLLNAIDVPVSLLASCGTTGRFFGNHNAIMAQQSVWKESMSSISKATEAKLETNDIAGFNMDVYRALKLDVLAKKRGLTTAMVQKCFSDPQRLATLEKLTADAAEKYNIPGTPSFIVNGELKADVHNLDSLKPYLILK